MPDSAITVDFWFDPSCPFTWRTSRWLVDVAGQRPLVLTWRLMSLAILNEGREVPEHRRVAMQQGRRASRVLVACSATEGQEALAKLYTVLGHRRHEQGQALDDEVLTAAVADVGLPAELATAAGDESYDAMIRASHDEGQQRVGTEAGSPVLALAGGRGFFGPVVVPIPIGEDAGRLFEAVRLLSSVPAFSEIKTARAAL